MRPINRETTCTQALKHVADSLEENFNPEIWLTRIRTREEKEAIRKLAKSMNGDLGPLRIRNSIPSEQLPLPRQSSQKEKMILKENFRNQSPLSKPFFTTHATLEDAKLPNLPARITLSAIDGGCNDPNITVQTDSCLFDTGAQFCSISADLID